MIDEYRPLVMVRILGKLLQVSQLGKIMFPLGLSDPLCFASSARGLGYLKYLKTVPGMFLVHMHEE